MTTVYIIRHAEKEKGDFYNPRLRHRDQPITLNGRLESQKLGLFFTEKQISVIYVSEYIRTAQTSEHVASQHNISPIIDKRLNEIDNGLFDRMSSLEEIQQTFPEEWKLMWEGRQDFRFPEGETGEEARARIAELLEEKRIAHEGENVIFVTHEGLIRTLMCHIMGLPVYQRGNFQVGLCGITEITYQPEYNNWKLIRFNQTMTLVS
jgi:broad specificity phosphatase PhoE